MISYIGQRYFSKSLKGASKKWMERHVNDNFVKQAHLQSYRSRASFKLIEIDQKYQLFRSGLRVIDVGAAPGGWSQVISDKVDSIIGKETVVAVDILPMEPIDGVKFVHGDIENDSIQEKVSELLDFNKADVVCSDAAPEFVGQRFIDHMRAIRLNQLVVKFCEKNLKDGGTLLMKIIQGPGEQDLYDHMKLLFGKLQRVKPSASRQESKEIYFLAQGYEQSTEKFAQDLRGYKKKLESISDEREMMKELEELTKESKDVMQKLINQANQMGQDLPDEIKDTIRNGPLKNELNIENKMSMREKRKQQEKIKEQEKKEFYEATGMKDVSKEMTMDNLIKQYKKEIGKLERKHAKMKELDKKGIEYDPDEITFSDDEEENNNFDSFNKHEDKVEKKYEDSGYDLREDPTEQAENEYQRISKKLQDLQGKIKDPNNPNPDEPTEKEYLEKYEELLEDIEKFTDLYVREDLTESQNQTMKDEMREVEKLYDEVRVSKDSFYKKRQQKQTLEKTGGIRPESPIWNDDK